MEMPGGRCSNRLYLSPGQREADPVAGASNESAVSKPITIEDDVFLSMNAVVLKGCSIDEGTVVTANTVVTGSLSPGVIAGGVPARVIQALKDGDLGSLVGQ